MSSTLRSSLIRLAHENVELRPHLLPILMEKSGVTKSRVPISQRTPQEQVRYYVGTALNALQAGAPIGAVDYLVQARAILGQTKVLGDKTHAVMQMVSKAVQVASGASPRAADEIVEGILKLLPPRT